MQQISIPKVGFSKGLVSFFELPAECLDELREKLAIGEPVDDLVEKYAKRRVEKCNLIFNFPRQQYAALDRGETPESINARWLTLSTAAYTNPATLTVSGETTRINTSTRAADPSNANNSIIRFLIEPGQFIGAWSTAILIGGAGATSTPGTGKIVAAVNDVKDDTNAPLNRDGTTVHLVNWKIKHLDSSEV